MSRIKVGDTVAFRRDVAGKCEDAKNVAAIRGVVTQICGQWLFMTETTGCTKVMPVATMTRVAHNGAILELV